MDILGNTINKAGIAYFAFNNRGTEIACYTKHTDGSKTLNGGCAYEDVLDSYYDIKGAINKMLELGFTKIHLQGHSLGCTKIVYSYNRLKEAANRDMPEIVLGAEVAYYSGISRLSNLKELCIDRTGLLLLEMPFSVWKEYTLKEVVEIATAKNIVVILAHIERYLKFQPYKTLEQLMEIGVLMQVNASYFAELRTRRKAISLLKKGGIQFLGSDCHNLTSRAPKLGTAYEVIKNKFGEDFVWQMNEYGNSLLV